MTGFRRLSTYDNTRVDRVGDAQENHHRLLRRNCHRKHVEDG